MTPTLSVDALHDSESDVWVVELTARPEGAVGACVSPAGAHAEVAADSVVRLDVFPAASYAATPSVYVVPQARPVNVVVLVAVVPAATPLRVREYPATPTLSVDAVQESETELTVAAVFVSPVGAVGAVVSPGATHALVDVVSEAWPEWLFAAS